MTLGAGNRSADDPVRHGGSLRVVSTRGDGFDDTYPLAAGRWRYLRGEGDDAGYKFGPTGSFRSILVKPGKILNVV